MKTTVALLFGIPTDRKLVRLELRVGQSPLAFQTPAIAAVTLT
jgi:hypothetical protein